MMIYLRAEAVYLIDSRDKEACLLYTSKLQTNSLTIHEMEAAYTNQHNHNSGPLGDLCLGARKVGRPHFIVFPKLFILL
jgi:hypothetical protein